jgi:siroheme synthase-like protein
MLDVTDRLVVIIGGGAVAVRKARGLLAAGAKRIRCVAPEFHRDMPGEVERVVGSFEASCLDGAELAFAATDSPAVNEAVVREAKKRGIWVNRADVDEEEPGDFTVPAVWRGAGVTLGVSAGGSAALAAKIRDDLAGKVDPVQVRMAELMQKLRPMIREQGELDAVRRREILRELAGPEAMRVLAERGEEGIVEWIRERWGVET